MRPSRRGCTVDTTAFPRRIDGHGPPAHRSRACPPATGIVRDCRAAIALPALSTPTLARGPENIADVAEKVIDAVVNISTSQKVEERRSRGDSATPQLPPGSPFEEFFEEFFKNRRGQGGDDQAPNRSPRRVNSLGSGFIIDASGIVVTNNHVIAEADEITVILNDGTRLKAEVVGRDTKTDLAVLRVKPTKPLKAVKFGDSDKLRLGEWVIAIGNPFSLGGSVTAGIVSARNRDINSGPYDNYIQTDAAINRGNSGGPLFNLDGDVIGVNTAIISPSGGSIGIGFAVPSKVVQAVTAQLQQFGEIRRGWLGVKIQQVTDEIAESLNIKPARGALVAGIDDKGPAKPAGIEAGDVIVKFDGKDIKEMRDLPRIVADTPVGRGRRGDHRPQGQGREEDREARPARRRRQAGEGLGHAGPPEEKSVVQKSLGLAAFQHDRRPAQEVQDQGRGQRRGDHRRRRRPRSRPTSGSPGSTIVAIEQEQMAAAADVQKKVDALKKAGKKTALLLVATAEGDMLFVALPIE